MSKEKRRCIFTNDIADTRLIIPPDGVEGHNWARQVPCSKKYLESKTSPEITEEEFKQIDLFFQLELSKAKVAHYLNAMNANMEKFKNKVFASDFAKLKPETIVISEEAFDQMMEEINNPPKPAPKLVEAMKKHKKHKEDNFAKESKKIIETAIQQIADSHQEIAPEVEKDDDLWT